MATGNKILVAMRSWVEEQLAALRAWIDAQLSNKVNQQASLLGANLDTLIPGNAEPIIYWRVYGATGTLPPGIGAENDLFITARRVVGDAWGRQTAEDIRSDKTFNRWFRPAADGSISFGLWVEEATATPPQEYDLPLAAGFSIGNIWYYKTQDDIVTVNFTNLAMQEGTYIVGDVIVGTLPVGYRPTSFRDGSCTLHSDDGSAVAAIVRILVDGSIHIINGAANQRSIHGEVSFVAAA